MHIHFYLERSKALKSPERTIYCYIRGIAKGKTIQINTKERIKPEYWDNEEQRAIERGKKKYASAKELNNFLESYREKVKKTVWQLKALNPTVDFYEIRAALMEEFGKSEKLQLSFIESLNKFIETRKKDMSPDSIRKYTTIKNHLKEYEKFSRVELNFRRIDLLFYDDFLTYLIETKGLVNNSAYKIIGLLKIFLNWAHERGLNPVAYFKKFKVKEDKVEVVALSEDELNALYNLDLKDNQRLDRARDLFLFGCYTGGRFSDLVKLTYQDIKNEKWLLRVGKTRDVLEIPLNDYALSILGKYSEEELPLPRLSNQKLNLYIKEVCQKAEFNETYKIVRYKGSNPITNEFPKWQIVTTHTARRTFITQSLLRGMSAEVVMSISGHKNYKTFKKYIEITSRVKKEAINKAWNTSSYSLRVVNFTGDEK